MGTVHNTNDGCTSCLSTFKMSICADNSNAPDFDWDNFHEELNAVKRVAVVTNIFYGLNWFLGICALTWATTVILGGIVTEINKRDYYLVAILLLLETLRLACARLFGFFVRRYIIYGSAQPTQLDYSDYRNIVTTEGLRIIGQIVLLIVLSISIVLPFRALKKIHHSDNNNANNSFDSIAISLRIFYIIVLMNAVIATLGVFYARTVVYFYISPDSHSLHKYYDTIVWNGLNKGLFECTDFDILKFAFQIQADEYRHYKRAPMVMYVYAHWMLYLYHHPKHKGFEAAKVALDSEDVFVREAAANIIGCWVKLRRDNHARIQSLLLQEKLLAKLASALEHDETGRAASYSFAFLAAERPAVIAKVRSESGEKLYSTLMKRIHQGILEKKPDKALVLIKAVTPILPEIIGSDESSSSQVRQNQLDINQSVNALVDHVKKENMYDNSAHFIFDLLNDLLARTGCSSSTTSSSQQRSRNVDIRLRHELTTLHEDLENILSVSSVALKRTKAIAAKALDTIYANEKLNAVIRHKLTPAQVVDSLMSVPQPNSKEQFILTDEWKYFIDVVDRFKGQSDDPEHNNLQLRNDELPSTWPDDGRITLRQIPDSHNLPCWLKNMKMTSLIVAAIMSTLMIIGIYLTIYLIP